MGAVRRIRWVVRGIVFGGILAVLLTGCFARRMTYFPPRVDTPSPPPVPFQEVRLDAMESHAVAWWCPPAPGRPTVLFFYGNASCLETCRGAGLLDRIRQDGTGVLSPDYPGYGNSAGNPSEGAIARVADAAIAWLRERPANAPIVVMGQSLGAGVAAAAACRHRETVSGLILLSPFTSLAAAARAHYPGWLVGLALRERYDSAAVLGRFGKPVLVIHGEDDEVIPVAQGRALAEAAGSSARFVGVPGARHNDLTDSPRAWDEVREFLGAIARAE